MSRQEPLTIRLERLRVERPNAYLALRRRYTEAFLAIEQDGVQRIEDAVDGDVEDQLFELDRELQKLN